MLRGKTIILSEVDQRISDAEERFSFPEKRSIFHDPVIKEELRRLHEHFVLCPIDKASGNVAIVCKQLYAKVILNELDTVTDNNSTYELVNEDIKDFVQ